MAISDKKYMAYFKTKPEVIRLKEGKDIETLYHETGHFWISISN